MGQQTTDRGESQGGNKTLDSDANRTGEVDANSLASDDLTKRGPQAAGRGEKEKRREKQEAPVGVEPTNGGFANRRRTPENTGKTRVLTLHGSKSAARRQKSRPTCKASSTLGLACPK